MTSGFFLIKAICWTWLKYFSLIDKFLIFGSVGRCVTNMYYRKILNYFWYIESFVYLKGQCVIIFLIFFFILKTNNEKLLIFWKFLRMLCMRFKKSLKWLKIVGPLEMAGHRTFVKEICTKKILWHAEIFILF